MIQVKKVKFPFSILLILLLLLGLVVYIGSYSYNRFSNIVAEVGEASEADNRLIKTKNLLSRISLAENSVKTYGLTKDSLYLDIYYNAVKSSDRIMNTLYQLETDSKKINKLNLQLLDSLIEKKFSILQDYLNLQDDYRVDIALNKVVNNIESKILEGEKNAVAVTEEKPEKRGFFNRLFGKKSNKKTKDNSKEKVEFGSIGSEVETVKREENQINRTKVEKELKLIMEDKVITQEIDSIVNAFEIKENLRVTEEAEQAAIEVHKINQQITLFFIVAGILVLFISILIVNYINASNRFRKALRLAKKEAENLADTKERFLNNMSHEIRTPMNAISGFIDQLAKSDLEGEKAEQVRMIQKSSDHLLHIIDEVLIYNKLQHKKSTLDNKGFDLMGLTDDLFHIMEPLANEKGIKLKLIANPNVPQILIGDPHKLNQILINVIGNAIKFTKKGSVSLVLNTTLKNQDSCHIRFEIIDTGIGMTDEQLSRIFNEFEQAEVSTTRDFGGTGLGLSITKMLVNLFGGSIDVKSNHGKGTKFIIELPFKIGTKNDIYIIREKTPKNKVLKNLNVLIVDDEPYNRKLLSAILNKHQANLSEVKNGREAIEEIKRNSYDLILMDSRMPELNGIDATKIIRKSKSEKLKNIPIIALSAAVSETDQKEYKKAGMNGFLPKPFKESELINEINKVFDPKKGKSKSAAKEKSTETIEKNLNFSQLKEISNGDETFFKEMLQTFIDETKEGIKKLKESSENKNWKMVAEYAHKISAPCNHISATTLYNYLKSLENSIRNNEFNENNIPNKVIEIEKESTEVISIVTKELNSLAKDKTLS